MAAVSREFLATLQALAHPDYDRAASEALLLSRLEAGLPQWIAAPADNLRRALPILAELMFLHGETENQNRNMGQMVNSQGQYLDVFGVEKDLPRRSGESDDDYLFRLSNSGRRDSLGSEEYYEDESAEFNTDIVDVKAVTQSNRQDIAVYALKANHAALTASESAALLAHLNLRRNKIGGVDVTVPAVTQTAFTIDVTVLHGVETSADTVAMDARAAIYAWLEEHQKIGDAVYGSSIRSAADVAGVLRATSAQPAMDLPAMEGVVYVCPSDVTNVIVRTTTTP